MKLIHIPVVLLLLVVVAISCKKKDKDSSPTVAQTVSYNFTNIDYYDLHHTYHYRIVYNAKNKIDSIVEYSEPAQPQIAGSRTFIYSDSGFVINYNFPRAPGDSSNVKVSTDNSGNVIKVIKGDANGGDTFLYTYSGTELIKTQVIPNKSAPEPVYTLTWTDGDLDGYLYDTTKWLPGDYNSIKDFLQYGYSLLKTKHLVVGTKSNSSGTPQYFYRFDTKGRISHVLIPSGSDTIRYTYTY